VSAYALLHTAASCRRLGPCFLHAASRSLTWLLLLFLVVAIATGLSGRLSPLYPREAFGHSLCSFIG
jgi:hypothetical protein